MSGPAQKSFLNALLTLVLAVQFGVLPTADAETMVDGTLPCAEWLKMRASGNAAAAELWLSGVLLTLAAAEGVDVRSTYPSIYERWMDSHCREDPRRTIGEGATKLLQELKRQRGRSATTKWLGKQSDPPRLPAMALRIESEVAQ